jgi:hypothetical protein
MIPEQARDRRHETSEALTVVRRVRSTALGAIIRLNQPLETAVDENGVMIFDPGSGWRRRPDPDTEDMIKALKRAVRLLDRWAQDSKRPLVKYHPTEER